MTTADSQNIIDDLLASLVECLTPEVAQRIVKLKAGRKLQSQVNRLANKSNAGTLTDAERAEYALFIRFSQFVTLLQMKARNQLDSMTRADSAR